MRAPVLAILLLACGGRAQSPSSSAPAAAEQPAAPAAAEQPAAPAAAEPRDAPVVDPRLHCATTEVERKACTTPCSLAPPLYCGGAVLSDAKKLERERQRCECVCSERACPYDAR